MITIIGLGSLLSKESATRTCPSLQNFRIAYLSGWKRVFNKTDSDFVKNNQMPVDHRKYACLSAIPSHDQEKMVISAFEIHETEWISFLKREFEYKLIKVPFTDQNSKEAYGILCAGDYTDDSECELVCQSDPYRLPLWEIYKSNCSEPMWRTDLLPDDDYIQRCINFVKEHGDSVYNNFIKTTYIGDQSQTIKDYLNLT